MMGAKHVSEFYSAYLDNSLPERTRQAVEAHLAACPQCAGELARMRALIGEMRDMPAPVMPSAMLADIRAAIVPSPRKVFPWRMPAYAAGVLAATCALILLLINPAQTPEGTADKGGKSMITAENTSSYSGADISRAPNDDPFTMNGAAFSGQPAAPRGPESSAGKRSSDDIPPPEISVRMKALPASPIEQPKPVALPPSIQPAPERIARMDTINAEGLRFSTPITKGMAGSFDIAENVPTMTVRSPLPAPGIPNDPTEPGGPDGGVRYGNTSLSPSICSSDNLGWSNDEVKGIPVSDGVLIAYADNPSSHARTLSFQLDTSCAGSISAGAPGKDGREVKAAFPDRGRIVQLHIPEAMNGRMINLTVLCGQDRDQLMLFIPREGAKRKSIDVNYDGQPMTQALSSLAGYGGFLILSTEEFNDLTATFQAKDVTPAQALSALVDQHGFHARIDGDLIQIVPAK